MLRKLTLAVLAAALCSLGLPASAQTGGTALGSVTIPRAVMAGGKALAAGTYAVRMTNDAVTPVLGQAASEAKWVEFLQGGQVKGKELATVLGSAEAKAIAKLGSPAAGSAKVQTLKGNDYVRVWINRGGTNYLVHLAAK